MRHFVRQFHKRIIACLLPVLLLAMLVLPVSAASQVTTSAGTNEVPYESYSYWEGLGGAAKTSAYTKPVYAVKTVINADLLGLPLLGQIGDICSDGKGNVYLLDSGSSKIYITDSAYQLKGVVDRIQYNGEELSIEGASGLFVKDGLIYVADTKGERVLVMDAQGNVSSCLTVPQSRLIPDDFNYRPQKVAVDSKNYTYVSCDGSYYGALVYSPELEFLGFYGANTVPATVGDVLKNLMDRLFSNDIKRGASVLSLPYQFVDMVVGPNDFIYTATGRQTEGQIMTGQVSVMNPGGKNILSGSDSYNFADTEVGRYNLRPQTESIVGIDVDADGFFYIVDATYGRVFWYDEECSLLGVFGGSMGTGVQQGTTRLANAVVINGTDVLVSDGTKNVVNVFSITAYGQLVRDAQLMTLQDDYEDAVVLWHQVLDQDQNSQLAYSGLAKGYYAIGDNTRAAEYARLGADKDTYSSAFEKLRTAFLEQNFALVFIGALVLIGGLTAFLILKKKKQFKLIRNEKVQVMLGAVPHPFESFRLVKEKQKGSLVLAFLMLALFYIVSAVKDIASGFAFNNFNASSYNSFYVFLSTVGLVTLWTVSNWLVSVLLGGIGKIKEIFIVTCYSLIPLIFVYALDILLTYMVTPDEYVFVQLLKTVCLLYAGFMLIVGIMKVHDFEFGRFLGTTALTLISMVIILFLLFLIILLAQQVFSWVMTLYVEIRYR